MTTEQHDSPLQRARERATADHRRARIRGTVAVASAVPIWIAGAYAAHVTDNVLWRVAVDAVLLVVCLHSWGKLSLARKRREALGCPRDVQAKL